MNAEYLKWEPLRRDQMHGFTGETVRGYLEGDEQLTLFTIEKLDDYLGDKYRLSGMFLVDEFETDQDGAEDARNHQTLEEAKKTANDFFQRFCRWNFKALLMIGMPRETMPTITKSIAAEWEEYPNAFFKRSELENLPILIDELEWDETNAGLGHITANLKGDKGTTLFRITLIDYLELGGSEMLNKGCLLQGAFIRDQEDEKGVWHESPEAAKGTAEGYFDAWCAKNYEQLTVRAKKGTAFVEMPRQAWHVCNVKPVDNDDGMVVCASSGIDALKVFLDGHTNMMHDEHGRSRQVLRFWVWRLKPSEAVEIQASPTICDGVPCVIYELADVDGKSDPIPAVCAPVRLDKSPDRAMSFETIARYEGRPK